MNTGRRFPQLYLSGSNLSLISRNSCLNGHNLCGLVQACEVGVALRRTGWMTCPCLPSAGGTVVSLWA